MSQGVVTHVTGLPLDKRQTIGYDGLVVEGATKKGTTMEKYQELVGKRCRITTTGEEVYVLGLHYDFVVDRYFFFVDDGVSRGTEVNAKFVELA